MRRIYEAAMILIGTIGWWGFVYPDLCLTEEVYEQEYEEEELTEAAVAWDLGQRNLAAEIFLAGTAEDAEADQSGMKIGSIRIKSRLVEYLYQER
ncbi:MAG: hypothetical protein K2N55_04095 [Lachnospiraceae bacterium]|nr:hypothetical protein [Lachnospiraceae bacterium]